METTAKDVQVREVNGGFVVILSTRSLNSTGNAVGMGQVEHVASTGADAAALINAFLTA